MILNYAAQAEAGLLLSANNLDMDKNIKETYVSFSQILGKYVHFETDYTLPDTTLYAKHLLDSTEPFKLPFPNISVSFRRQGRPEKCCLLVDQKDEGDSGLFIQALAASDKMRASNIGGWFVSAASGTVSEMARPSLDFKPEVFLNMAQYEKNKNIISFGSEEQDRDVFGHSAWVVIKLLSQLANKNEYNTETRLAARNNKKRIRKGKLPFYEVKTVVVRNMLHKPHSTVDKCGSTRNSPRVHMRRGYFRRSLKGNVWVKPCVVGSKENGLISQRYVI